MGYIMKGSPAKLGTIKGTSGHKSALKDKGDDSDDGKSHNKVHGEGHGHPPGTSFAAGDKIRKQRAPIEKKISEEHNKEAEEADTLTGPKFRSPAKQKEFKVKVGKGQGSKRTGKYINKHGERDYSGHNIATRGQWKEGTISQQDALRGADIPIKPLPNWDKRNK